MSISQATDVAEKGRIDEVASRVNTQTFEGAQETNELTAMTKQEQANAMSASLAMETETESSKPCPDGAPVRTFNVSAIQVSIDYNKYGQHDPNGVMYALDSKVDDIREHERNEPNATIDNPNPNVTSELVQPLTIRAHVGDCVKIRFTNELNKAASMHVSGVSYNPNTSAGSAVGINNESVAQPGETVTYTWYMEKKGTFMFADKAQSVMHDGDDTLRQHGLFGSITAYEEDETWLDPETGEPLKSGVKAMINDSDGPDYRDFAVYYHDDASVRNADGSKPTWPHSTKEQSLYTINYRGDPTGARIEERNESECPACDKEETFYSSWVHGDPGGGDLVFPTYLGDPVKWRLIGAAVEENHVDHHHGHRWKSEPGDSDSNTQDSQTVSPGATYTREFVAGFGNGSARTAMGYKEAFKEGAAGYVQGSPGDYIFHCHLFPHYASGMWAIMRVYDTDTRDMNQSKPGIYKLQPLPDREEPPAPNSSDPGYPNYIPAKKDHRPPQPPASSPREPTELEESAINGTGMTDPIKPGAPYVDPCPEGAETITYNISVIKTNITYNQFGDYDDDATIFVLSKHVDEIRNGTMRPRPLVIRANVGQCVNIKLTNELPEDDEPNEISMHVHFVGYDVMGSDGVTLGYNYDEGAEPVGDNETRVVNPANGSDYRVESNSVKYYRWYADERGTIFWHDHLSGFKKGMHGTFGSLIVEPKGSEWLDPKTGEPIRTGTKAMIKNPNGENYREFVLLYQDFVRLHHKDGDLVNGPHSDDLEDQGSMGINYANAPLYHRTQGDPAYAFSSWMHGDPMTPLLRTYPNEPVKIRVLQGTYEEAHNFMISGVKWRQEQYDRNSPLKGVQTFGVSEQFVMSFDAPKDNPADLEVEDHLYGSMPLDDIWNGMWGLFRVYGSEVDDLEPLPGHEPPSGVINESERELLNETNDAPPTTPTAGNPCPADADKRAYNVVAFQANISYNDYGDHDPHGVVFATKENYLDWKENGTELEPLVLRAEKGECVEITLTNKLPQNMSSHSDHARVPVRPQGTWENSNRISLHSTLLNYTALYSSGITAGFNYDQTVGPGGTITYRWYADKQVGTTSLFDMADVRNHKHHGAYGSLVVEPKGSKWLDPQTGEPGKETGPQAIIVQPDGNDFREYVVVAADGQYIVNPDGSCVVPPGHEANEGEPCNQVHGDPEDQGYKSINYDAEPLTRRLNDDSREWLVFSSKVHGDPATPVFEAYRGDPVKFRVTMGADKPRMLSFELGGHVFPYQSTEKTQYVGVRGEIGPGSSVDVVPLGGAGGPQAIAGDYYYGASKLRNYVEGGMWGIFRVHGEPAGIEPLPDRAPDAPTNLTVETPDRQRTLDLDWSDHPNPEVEGYNVYRSAKSGGPYTKVNNETVTNSSYRDDELLPGTTYHYVVTAVDKYGQESRYSAEANGTTKPLVRLDNATDDVLDDPVRTEVEIEIEADSEAELDRVKFEVEGTDTEVKFDVENGSIETTGDAIVDATMDPQNDTYEVVWDTAAESDGDLDVRIRARDTDGRRTEVPRTVTVDNTIPDAEVEIDGTLASELNTTLTGDVALDVNATDNTTGVDAVRYRIDNGTGENLTEQNGTWSGTINTSVLVDGSHELEVKTEDDAGNVFVRKITIDTDNTAPAFDTEIDGAAADTLDTALNGNVSVTVNASDSVSGVDVVKLKIDDGSWHKLTKDGGKWKKTIKTKELSDGGHKLKLKAVDKVGNEKIKTFDIETDNTAPSEATKLGGTDVSLLEDPVSNTVEVGIDADDATSGVEKVEIELDDDGWETVTDSDGDGVWETDLDTTTLSDGAHKLEVRVTDGAGNTKLSKYDFEADNTDPEFDAYIDGTLISLLDSVLSGDVDLEVDATDDLAGIELVEYEIDDNGYTEITDGEGDGVWETTIDTTNYDDGDHVIRIKVIDKAGNTKIKKFEITIDNLV